MTRQFPNVSSPYGAPMGRPNQPVRIPADLLQPRSVRLYRVRLDAGGYDDGGAYWGIGAPLYCAEGEGFLVFKRADSRAEAARTLGIPSNALSRPLRPRDHERAGKVLHWTDGSGRLCLTIRPEEAEGGGYVGDCTTSISSLAESEPIAAQLAKLNPEVLRACLKEYGAWDADELADHDANLQRILWIACGDCNERPEGFKG